MGDQVRGGFDYNLLFLNKNLYTFPSHNKNHKNTCEI